ncbi:hypothetical protein Nisw_03060 [Candidatus Nitrosopumilus sp. SW]|uniref:hypothetical protein n=1 Tax=Candidatus Nitrosopumilus sp. SW TaxID=2508726 RepID=UPI001154D104|nr:hypothetical protein [Candidatus Nitrosopumilus sp. SW]QDI88584.1 hypothetical protein Nisw_03060 [Candidatus Nitrosopumilus sp. SW]
MDNLDNAKHDHQKNKSDIVNLVKQMFAQDKWGDEEYRTALEALVKKDRELVAEVTRIIKRRHSEHTGHDENEKPVPFDQESTHD